MRQERIAAFVATRRPPAFRYRDYRLYWLGDGLSSIGTQFTTVAMAWQIYELTSSPLQLGLLGLAQAIPRSVSCSWADCSPMPWIDGS